MIEIELICEGTMPILLHRATEEALLGKTRTNVAEEAPDPRDIAGRAVYRMPDSKQLALPGSAFGRLVREAGGSHKIKGSRKSLKYVVPAAVVILSELCPLFLKDRKTACVDFEVDARPVTIPATKGRVMRYRARLNEWSVKARMRIDETVIAESLVRQLFNEGFAQIGLGDFRPACGGPFGVSQIVSWQVLSDPKPRSEAQRRNGSTVAARD
jgi:hypothetical protein